MSSQCPTATNSIPFTFLCSLFREISGLKPQVTQLRLAPAVKGQHPALKIFRQWLKALTDKFGPLPKGTTAICLYLLFPEEDVLRKYDMQEPGLIQALSNCFGIHPDRFSYWNAETSLGCLGDQLRHILQQRAPTMEGYIGPLSIAEISQLLDELAATSGYSDMTIRNKYPKQRRRPRDSILRDLYRDMDHDDAAFLTQIVLKDLRPLLYPLSEIHYTASLKTFNSDAVKMLTKEDVMRTWDPSGKMIRAYRVTSSFVAIGDHFELPPEQRVELKPENGVPIEVPKCRKGQSCYQALSMLHCSNKVWAETKYDGERAQIHVKLLDDGTPQIKIFSKSKRDSTNDRHELHKTILEAVSYLNPSSQGKDCERFHRDIILDAEMVAFSGESVAEFWRIRRLIEATAYGVRHVTRNANIRGSPPSQASLLSDDSEDWHLGLIFFDILMVDSINLLTKPYHERRAILESLIHQTPGKALLARCWPIDMRMAKNTSTLRQIFSEHIADHQEGLVLKADDSEYNDDRLPWVKLKKDYIPGYGDSVDMILVGASWEKGRARELRVAPGTFTTFYIGALRRNLQNAMLVSKPQIEVLFTVSYGLTRDQLEDLNFQIKGSDTLSFPSTKTSNHLPYTISVSSGLQSFPTVILRNPLLIELFGAGFTKAPQSSHYEPRFPRMTKVHRPKERSWTDGMDLRRLHDIACKSVGRDRSDKDVDDWTKSLFGKQFSPGIRCPTKRKAATEEWEEKLWALDRKHIRTADTQASPNGHPKTAIDPIKTGDGELAEVILGPLATMTNLHSPPKSKELHSPLKPQDKANPSISSSVSNAAHHTLNSHHELLTPAPPWHPPIKNQPLSKSAGRVKIGTGHLLSPNPQDTFLESFEQSYVWFSRPQARRGARPLCPMYSQLKRRIPHERRIHSLESLLAGCGWDEREGTPGCIYDGIIVVEDHDSTYQNQLDSIIKRLEERRLAVKLAFNRKSVSIYSSKALASGCKDPVYQLNCRVFR